MTREAVTGDAVTQEAVAGDAVTGDPAASMPIDWAGLHHLAVSVAQHAYAPYSGLLVGAAGLTDTGALVAGCNVENASYGLTLCAECGLISDLHRSAPGERLIAVVIVTDSGESLLPCGRCRQLLHEAGGADLAVWHLGEPTRLDTLLPDAFGAVDLDGHR